MEPCEHITVTPYGECRDCGERPLNIPVSFWVFAAGGLSVGAGVVYASVKFLIGLAF